MKRKKRKIWWFLILLILIGVGGLYFYFAEREVPEILIQPHSEFINPKTEIKISATDLKSGLRKVEVYIIQNGLKTYVFSQIISGKKWDYKLQLSSFALKEGNFILYVRAVDRSWNNFFKGNERIVQKRFYLDTSPPLVIFKGYNRYVYQGGCGIVVFKSNEPLIKAGVRVGDVFFPAYKYKDFHICLYTFLYNCDPYSTHPHIYAEDRALNVTEVSVPCVIKRKIFPREKINITQDFLNRKMIQFLKIFPEKNLLNVFLKVNSILRKKCREKLRKICNHSKNRILWQGVFLRQPNSKKMSGFGVKRSYLYNGKKIDEQTHLGIDLASITNAKILASNNGIITYTGFLGIYGKTVIIDHGLGLFTLYGHLSNILVKKGDYIKKRTVIGYSGQTGLAGGDHLHFAILISGIPANPLEWWDKKWLENNILPNLPFSYKK